MKGKIIDIGIFEDEFKQKDYRVVLSFEKEPPFKLGEAELKQND